MGYLFVDDARARLAAAEDLLDDGTARVLERFGVKEGWRCLEVGAGGGSIARWLAERGADVAATDITIDDLDPGSSGRVEVRAHNVVTDPLESCAFDLVHARLLLEHLPEREAVLQKLVAALKPGGWLIAEDVDYVSAIPVSALGGKEHAHTQAMRLHMFANSGVDHNLGRALPSLLRAAGLEGVDNAGRVWVMEGGTAGARWFKISMAHLRPRLVGPGKLSDAEVDRMLDLFDNPAWSALSPIVMAAWGRCPAL